MQRDEEFEVKGWDRRMYTDTAELVKTMKFN